MDNAPIYQPSQLGILKSNINVSKWDDVMDSYENKAYKDAMLHMIDYINPAIKQTYSNGSENAFSVPHGSIIVNFEVTDTHFTVNAPFVKLPEGGSIPILRQVAQLNFWPVGLANIVLDGDDQLTFEFTCPLEMCEPYKIYDVLREICTNADRYDDLFINKFKAIAIREPIIQRHEDSKLETIWDQVQTFITEAENYIDYFENKRWNGYVFDALYLVLLKIDYYCAPQGMVRTEIEDHIDDLLADKPLNERIYKAKKFLQRLKSYDKSAFLDDVYMAEVFIPFKYRSDINAIRKNFQSGYDTAKSEMENNNHLAATLTLSKEFYRLFYYNNVDTDTANKIKDVLEACSQKTWTEAANKLWQTMNSLYGNDNSQQEVTHSRSERR